jgi:predicted lipid carrier protein YhbT
MGGSVLMELYVDEVTLPALMRRMPAAVALPLGPVLTLSLRSFARRRPDLFERLGEHRRAIYLIAPTDLSFAFRVTPDGPSSDVRVIAGGVPPASDVVIRGPIMALLGLLDGTFDGDALFFHRTLSIVGRTEAVVALRNAIENAELHPSDLLGLTGRAGRVADEAVIRGIDMLRRIAAACQRRAA